MSVVLIEQREDTLAEEDNAPVGSEEVLISETSGADWTNGGADVRVAGSCGIARGDEKENVADRASRSSNERGLTNLMKS